MIMSLVMRRMEIDDENRNWTPTHPQTDEEEDVII